MLLELVLSIFRVLVIVGFLLSSILLVIALHFQYKLETHKYKEENVDNKESLNSYYIIRNYSFYIGMIGFISFSLSSLPIIYLEMHDVI